MATRQVIALDQSVNSAGNLVVTAAYWLVAPSSRVRPLASPSSGVQPQSSAAPWGLTDAELALLRAGTIVEQVAQLQLTGTGQTLSTVEAALAANYAALQGAYTAAALAVAHIVGASWDGTTWTPGP
jgi:hypothetical protein